VTYFNAGTAVPADPTNDFLGHEERLVDQCVRGVVVAFSQARWSRNIRRLTMNTIARIAAATAAALLSALPVAAANATTVPAALPTCQGSTPLSVVNDVNAEIPTTFNGTGNAGCVMSLGSFGSGVVALQDTLNHCYPGNNLTEDGNFGPLTRQALERAQSADHITVDGVYGPQTLDHLAWWDPIIIECGRFGAP
jgi:peptidoglycan hydrolase-like protein with peptidoglycan-binding domain